MNPLLGLGLISGIGSLGSSLLNQQIGFDQSKKLMDYQYKLQQEAIDKQNLYNSPAEQIKRLTLAQLNPNLVYGSGVDGNQSSAASPAIAHRQGQIENPLQDLPTNYLNQKQLDLQEIATRNQAFESRARRLNLEAKTMNVLLDNEFLDKSMETRLKRQSQELINSMQKQQNLEADEALTWSRTRNEDNKLEQILAETDLLRSRKSLTNQQALTEVVKRTYLRSGIAVNNARVSQIVSLIDFIDEGTNLRRLQGRKQGLDFDVEKAYKEFKAKHPGIALTLDAFKEFLDMYHGVTQGAQETLDMIP